MNLKLKKSLTPFKNPFKCSLFLAGKTKTNKSIAATSAMINAAITVVLAELIAEL